MRIGGVRIDQPEWFADGACRNLGPAAFFPEPGRRASWWPEVASIERCVHESRRAAEAAERALIMDLRPSGNVQGNPDAPQPFYGPPPKDRPRGGGVPLLLGHAVHRR